MQSLEQRPAGEGTQSHPLAADEDSLYADAVAVVRSERRGSISLIQRSLQIGYNRAARLLEQMESEGVVSPMQSNGQRQVMDIDAPDGSYQRPAAEGIEAVPLAAPAQPKPVQATTPAPDGTPATHGQASTATGLAVGVRVLVLDTASGVKQAARVGQQGVIDKQVGPEAWDVRFEGKHRKVPQWVCFHASELEVLA